MNSFAARNPDVEDPEPPLVDVTRMGLPELLLSKDTALANSIDRLLREMADPEEIIAAFSSYVR